MPANLRLLLLCAAIPLSAGADGNWHFLSQAKGGTISLIKGLTQHECEFIKHRALNEPATPEEQAAQDRLFADRTKRMADCLEHFPKDNIIPMACADIGSNNVVINGNIRTAECFQ